MELEPLTQGTSIEVREARLLPSAASGEVRQEGAEWVQSGFSRVDFLRRITPGESLAGRFAPPSGGKAGQKFEIYAEYEDGSGSTLFEWSPSLWDRVRRSHRFREPLDGEGLVRISLLASGQGPPGRWSDLALEGAEKRPTGPPPVPAFEPPDVVVLYVMDALRGDAISHLGGLAGTTPVVDRLAREGVSFRAHRSNAPNTLPSTKALLTGEAWVDRGGWKLPEDGATSLAELWRRAGYRTGLFSGNPYVGPAYGVDRGFEHVTEASFDETEATYNDNAERLHKAAREWLATLGPEAGVFLYVHAVHPHTPYDPPEPWRSDLTQGIASDIDGSSETLLSISQRRRQIDAEDRRRLERLYAAGLAYNDAELGRFLDDLEHLFRGRRIFVAVTSDHGEELFDHGGVLHGYTLYDEMIRIPLVVWSPGLVVPGEFSEATSTLDLHATLAALAARAAGLDPGTAEEGRSLLPLLLGERRDREPDVHLAAAASVKGGIYSVQNERWKLVWAPRSGLNWGLGAGPGRTRSAEYLFDLVNDPSESENRAGEGGLEAAWLRARLRAWIEAKQHVQDGEAEPQLDEKTRRRLEALGYVD